MKAIRFVLDFFASIVLNEDEFKYILMLCAVSMEGFNRFGEFYLLIGATMSPRRCQSASLRGCGHDHCKSSGIRQRGAECWFDCAVCCSQTFAER